MLSTCLGIAIGIGVNYLPIMSRSKLIAAGMELLCVGLF
jgi:hypothetical protein